jgi:SAM-dependent methyltransferase
MRTDTSIDESLRRANDGRVHDALAAIWDVTDVDRSADIKFYCELARPPVRALLDLGCGTGTITVPMARALRSTWGEAHQVVGVDESAMMLKQAAAKDRRIGWVAGDLRSLPLAGSFDLITCCYNTLQGLVDEPSLRKAFLSIATLLSPRGTFAFDVYQPNIKYLSAPYSDRLARRGVDRNGRQVEVREDIDYDARSRILGIHWRVTSSHDQTVTAIADIRYEYRQYTYPELERHLHEAGLRVRDRYGDFDRSTLTAQSRKLILLCGHL